MQSRLDFIKLQPQRWVHWEPLQGGLQAHRALQKRYPQAEVWLSSEHPQKALLAKSALKGQWWQLARWLGPRVQEGLPAEGQAQMLWANMQLHTAVQPQKLLSI